VTDPNYTGRGVNVTGVRVSDQRGPLFDGDRHPPAFTGVNWVPSTR
jgi:hypothetical protein